MFRETNESVLNWVLKQMKLLINIARKKYSVIYVSGISWLTPQLTRFLSRGASIFVYDSSNIQTGVMKTLRKNILIILIVTILEALYIKGADLIVPCGVSFRDYYKEKYSRANNIILIPDPVDTQRYADKAVKTGSDLNHDKDRRLKVVYTSTFDTITVSGKESVPRGWEIVEVLSRLEGESRNRIVVYFVGKGPSIDNLEKIVSEKNVGASCIFTGFLSDSEFMDVMVSAHLGFMEDYSTLGYRYSVGSKIQEYMSAGLAVITGNSPEKVYMLRDQNIPQLLFSPLDIDSENGMDDYLSAVESAFVFALDNIHKLGDAGDRNRKRANAIFGLNTVRKMVQGLYDRYLKSGF